MFSLRPARAGNIERLIAISGRSCRCPSRKAVLDDPRDHTVEDGLIFDRARGIFKDGSKSGSWGECENVLQRMKLRFCPRPALVQNISTKLSRDTLEPE